MSLLSIGAVGVYRDLAPYAQRIAAQAAVAPTVSAATHPGPATAAITTDAAVTAGADAGSVASFGQLLVAQIPSEALLAYTTLLALFSVASDGYQTGRWVLYGVSLLVCAIAVIGAYLAKRNYSFADTAGTGPRLGQLARHLPWLPMVTSVLAMAVYGLTVPGNALEQSMSGKGFAITAGCLAVGGGLMMSLFAPFLALGNGATATPAGAANPLPAQAATSTDPALADFESTS